MKRISAFAFAAATIVFTSCSTSVPRTSGNFPNDEWGHRAGPRGFSTVIIDAGHGGKDSGAVSRHNGQREKDLALDVARRLKRELAGKTRAVLMRDSDVFIDLDDRVNAANRYRDAVLVSIHFNSGPGHVQGPETYYWRVDSHGLAVRSQRAMRAVSPREIANRGMVRRRLRLTRNPDMPCLLLELGYLSHPEDARLAADPAYRAKMASAIAKAILDQQREGDSGTGPLPAPRWEPPSRPTDAKE